MRLLLVEDKESFRRLLVQALGDAWEVTAVGDAAAALTALEAEPYGILVTDLRLPGMSGLDLLKSAKRRQPALRAVLMSAFGEPRDIVEAMRWGADDFLPKPFDLDQFGAALERLRALVEAPPPDPREPWVAHSPVMRILDLALAKAAQSDVAVVFQGEQGSGRSRAARRLHVLRHPQAPYLCLAAPSLPPGGAGERLLALLQGGSLYLSDLEALGPEGGRELVRAMDSPGGRGVHWMGGCRELRALPELMRLRLGVINLTVPPLRDRREDILPTFRALLEGCARRDGRAVPMVDRAVERDLLQNGWPGNLGQLAWAVVSAWRATAGPVLAPLPPGPGPRPADPGPAAPGAAEALVLPWPAPGPLDAMLDAVRRDAEGALLRQALAGRRGDPARVAEALGLSTRRFASALREHGISLEEE
jgi:DNA-binding NtrC family response regulator